MLQLDELTTRFPATHTFNNYTEMNSQLSSSNIRICKEDEFGNKWIGNYGTGIDFISHSPYLFDVLPIYGTKNGQKVLERTYGVDVDENGDLWVGTWGIELYVFNQEGKRIAHFYVRANSSTIVAAKTTGGGEVALAESWETIKIDFTVDQTSHVRFGATFEDEAGVVQGNTLFRVDYFTLECLEVDLTAVADVPASQGLAISTEENQLVISSAMDCEVSIYAVTGQLSSKKLLRQGETARVRLAKGVYLVNGTKVLIK